MFAWFRRRQRRRNLHKFYRDLARSGKPFIIGV